jgi:hypothetical protein
LNQDANEDTRQKEWEREQSERESERLESRSSAAYQAIEKLRVRSAVRGRIVAIYRECLFALKDGELGES